MSSKKFRASKKIVYHTYKQNDLLNKPSDAYKILNALKDNHKEEDNRKKYQSNNPLIEGFDMGFDLKLDFDKKLCDLYLQLPKNNICEGHFWLVDNNNNVIDFDFNKYKFCKDFNDIKCDSPMIYREEPIGIKKKAIQKNIIPYQNILWKIVKLIKSNNKDIKDYLSPYMCPYNVYLYKMFYHNEKQLNIRFGSMGWIDRGNNEYYEFEYGWNPPIKLNGFYKVKEKKSN